VTASLCIICFPRQAVRFEKLKLDPSLKLRMT
jgi:hypothetical protein